MQPKSIGPVKETRTRIRETKITSLFWLAVFQVFVREIPAAKEVPVYEVNAIAGDNVRLPCNISIIEDSHREEDSVVLVLWYREDLGTPIYSVDVRGKDFDRAEKWSDDNVLNNRANFEPDLKSSSLVIDRISENDAAVYRCRVDFKYAQTRNSKVNLTIIVPPQKIVIADERNEPKTTVVGPYPEKSDLTLVCQVFGGKPLPSVRWLKNSRLLNTTWMKVVSKNGTSFVQSTLVLRHLRRSDLHSQLTCEGRNNLNRSLSAMVQVDMNFSPLDVRILADEQPLTAKRKYDLVCESTGSRPPAKITWWKNNDRLESTKDSVSSDGNTTSSTLTFVPTKEDKGKYLKCRAENPVIINGNVQETRWKLQIHYVPETKIVLGTSLKPDSIKEGMDVYFDCIINAHPSVYKVEWRRNNKQLQHNIQKGVIISNQSLVLQSVTRSNAGNYTCIGYNAEGDGVSQPLHLNVMYAPFCKPNQTKVYGIAKNEIVNITCEVEANPLDLVFHWKFNNSAESEDIRSKMVKKTGTTVSVVSHMPMQEVDYGTLMCSASNKVGDQRVPCVFHVIAAGKPDTVSNCSVNNISVNSFSVRCLEGFNGGLPQTFNVVVKEEQDQSVANSSSREPWFTISGLQPGTWHRIFVYSTNVKGHSEPYVLEVVTLGKRIPSADTTIDENQPEKQRRHFHLTTTMGIIIAAVILLFSFVCVTAIVFKIRCVKSSSECKRQKTRTSNGNLHATESDKIFPSPIHDNDDSVVICPTMNFNAEADDKNPDIIPQPVGESDKNHDYIMEKQHISTIENRYLLNQKFLQYSNTPIGYSGYCTLRTGIVPLQDLCHLNTKTTTIHGDMQYLSTSSGTLPRHPWPTYTGTAVAGVQNHQCAYQTLPSISHQQIQTQISVPPTLVEKSLSNSSLVANKQESTV